MKLAFTIFKYYPYGGLQRDCLRLAKYCAEQGHEVHLFTMKWEGERPDSINIQLVPRRGFANHSRAKNFTKQIKAELADFDRVIGFDRMPYLDFYFAGDLCFAATANEKHGFWYKLSARYRHFKALESAVFQAETNTKIFVLTELVKQSYKKVYATPDERFYLIPPGIKQQNLNLTESLSNKKILRTKFQFEENVFYGLQIGSDFKRKGVDRSIKAIAALPQTMRHKTKLLIIGRSKVEKYKQLANSLNVSEQISFLGTCDDVHAYMQAADFLIHPAYFETAGMVLIEALTLGLPVLVTETCGYAFHVDAAEAGMIITAPFKQAAMNQQLESLLDTAQLAEFSKNALDYATKTDLYSMDQVCLQRIVGHT